ncbi:MAG: glycosyltransferase [Pseudomonadales bacterium]
MRGDDLRVVMICDDVQIDRRILQEAASLDRLGYEVIILGRSADGYPADERIGNVKVERLNYESYAASRAARRSAEQALQAGDEADADIPLSIDGAEAELAARLRLDASGKPRYPAFVDRLPRTPRVLLRALFWPPYRLDLIRRAAPRLHWTLQYLIYLPTLAVTPWPRAVAWHWRRIASRMGRSRGSLNEKPDFTTPAMQALEHQVSRFDDMNVWELAVYERALLLQPDIVHVHDLPQLRPGVFVSRRLGIPALYDAHELYPEIHTLTPDQQERLAVVEKHFSPRVNAMITVNPFIARRQAEWYGIQEPAVVLNAAEVDELIELTRPDTLREALGLDASAAVLLFQGWISIDRRIGDLVSAMPDTHESVHLVLLGYGTDIPALKQLAQTLGVAHRVHFPPPVPQSELMHWVSSADAGMIPYQPIDANHLYCSPNKLFEFIAATVPIIANDLPYLRSVVADNGFGIVQTLNTPADYAAAINAMFDPALGGAQRFRATIRNGREAYLWPAQEKVLYGIYDAANITAHRRVKTSPASSNTSPTSAVPAAARHLAPQSLRIFHGLHNIAGIPSIMARAERALGLDSRAVCFSTGHFAYKPDIEEPQLIAGNDILARFRRHAEAYDIFVFHFGHSLANDSLADIPLLKRMGKRIVFYFHGCDIRQSKETIRKYRFSACAECWPPRCNANRDHALDFALRFADAIWVSTPDLLEFVPGAELFVQPIDIDAFEFRAPAPSETSAQRILLHAPSDPKLKGTAHLLKAVEAINANGPRIDLQLLQGLANSEVRERILSADIAVDQLLIGSYGMFAVELMASGVPVICNIRQDLIDKFPEPPPVIRADPDNLADVLLETLLGAELWPDLAVRARRYAETYHSAEAAARRSTATYQRIMGKTLSAEHEQQDRIRHTASR